MSPAHRAEPEPGWDASFERPLSEGLLHAPASREAFSWRYGGRESRWRFFRDVPHDARVVVVTKSRTKHGFRELMVGDVLARRGTPPEHVRATLRALVADAKRAGNVDAVTALVNPACAPLWRLFRSAGFWRTSRTVPFIAKGVRTSLDGEALADPASWSLLFADVDTW